MQRRLGGPSDEQLLRQATERIAAGDVPADVPARVAVFGLASLPSPHLEVLAALSVHREVHLFAPVASARRWRYVTEQRLALGMLKLPVERSDETVPVGNGNPLVTGWGRSSPGGQPPAGRRHAQRRRGAPLCARGARAVAGADPARAGPARGAGRRATSGPRRGG